MLSYVIRRIVLFFPTLLILSALVFFSTRMIPGDPAQALLADAGGGSTSAYETMRERMGLNQAFVPAYIDWLSGVLRGDLGESLRTGSPVIDMFKQRFPVTIEVALLSWTLTILLALPLGVVSALTAGKWMDYAIRLPTVFLMAVPNFWFGVLAILIPLQLWGYAPPLNYVRLTEDPFTNLRTVLPMVLVMSLTTCAPVIRMTRTNLLDVLSDDYVRTARAKGLINRAVVFRHALPNAMIPTMEVIVSRAPVLLSGVIIMETVFNVPGLGRTMVDAVNWRDYTSLQALVLFNAILALTFNLLADLTYAWLDPRVRYD